MKLTGERLIPASPQVVWNTLLDPDVLKASIPGCELLTKKDDETFEAAVTIKVGPIKAKFAGQVSLSDLAEPSSCTISGQGSGGVAGFAKGGARISLLPDGDQCNLTYDADVAIGGKIASLGDRLFRTVVQKNIDDFFNSVAAHVREDVPGSP